MSENYFSFAFCITTVPKYEVVFYSNKAVFSMLQTDYKIDVPGSFF